MIMIMFMIQSLSLEFHHGINGGQSWNKWWTILYPEIWCWWSRWAMRWRDKTTRWRTGEHGAFSETMGSSINEDGGIMGISWDFTFFFPWVTPTDGGNDSYFGVDSGTFYHPQLCLGCWEPCLPWTHLGFVMKKHPETRVVINQKYGW